MFRGGPSLHPLVAAVAIVFLPAVAPAALDLNAALVVNLPGPNNTYTTFSVSTHDLPGTVDTGPIGTGAAGGCPDTLGPGYVCARGVGTATFDSYLAGTLPTPLPIGVLTLGAQAKLQVHDAPAVRKFQIDAQAVAYVPFGCYAPSPGVTGELILNVRFDGTRSVSSDPGLTTFAGDFSNQPATCTTGGGLCHGSGGSLACDGHVKTQQIALHAYALMQNDQFLTGWDATMDIDASHTMTIESADLVDDQSQPIPGARVWIAGDDGQPAAYLLRTDEVGVVGPLSTTTTTSPTIVTTSTTPGTTSTSTTSTTVPAPPCAGQVDAALVQCRCAAATGLPDCSGIKLPKAVRSPLSRGCTLGSRAAQLAPGTKHARLLTRAGHLFGRFRTALARPRKHAVPAACRAQLEGIFP